MQLHIVESIKKFVIANKEVSEFVLNTNSMTGTFQIGEEITGTVMIQMTFL